MSSEGSDDVKRKFTEYEEKMRAALYILADTGAKMMEAWAKENAHWVDRTSNARQGLKGSAYWDKDTIIIVLSHSVDYGVWLELANQRKYAILQQSILSKKDEVMQNYKKLLGA